MMRIFTTNSHEPTRTRGSYQSTSSCGLFGSWLNKSERNSKLVYASLFLLLMFTGCKQEAPVIHSISPQVGIIGEPVVIKGAFFGNERDESYVTVAGAQPTSTSYLNWQDDEITILTPEFGQAGLVYVYVRGKKSNGELFANQAAMPKPVQDDKISFGPRITQVSPQSGSIGSVVSITGTGFGNSRGNSGVFFSWKAETPVSVPVESVVQEYTEALETELGYELWNEREIRVRVPDGAVSGNMEIRSPRGNSLPHFYEISNRQGSKTFRDKRSYTLSYSVNIKTGAAEAPNTLYLWLPRPAPLAAQRNIELLSSNVEPFVENYRGTSLFKLDNLPANSETQINLSWKVDVYGIETSARTQSIRQEDSPIGDIYTESNDHLPAKDTRIRNQAAAILGRERNPYTKAQRIYEWMLGNFTFLPNQIDSDIFKAMETKKADSYTAALLYSALLRSAGVPCQPVAGVLVSRNRQTMNHYWAEFWIDGFGWIPVDPVMGSETIPAVFNSHPDRKNYYFGNIDSQRIAFTRGYSVLSPMDPRGRTVTHNRSYSLQSLWEEVVGGIESYSSLWGAVTITGMYAQ